MVLLVVILELRFDLPLYCGGAKAHTRAYK
jgi:hypothetical protein